MCLSIRAERSQIGRLALDKQLMEMQLSVDTDIPPLCIPYKITWECFGSVGADFKPVGIVGMNTAEGQADSTANDTASLNLILMQNSEKHR